MNLALLSCGPFLTLFVAAGLRIVSVAQPETSSSGARRNVLNWISYFLTAISIVGMLFLAFNTGHIGIPGFILIAILALGLLEAEVRVAGARNRARQVEFLWVLAMAVKSGRPLADEIEAYSQGTWGLRHRKSCGNGRSDSRWGADDGNRRSSRIAASHVADAHSCRDHVTVP